MYGKLEGERTDSLSDVNGRSQGRERDQERLILKESEVSKGMISLESRESRSSDKTK